MGIMTRREFVKITGFSAAGALLPFSLLAKKPLADQLGTRYPQMAKLGTGIIASEERWLKPFLKLDFGKAAKGYKKLMRRAVEIYDQTYAHKVRQGAVDVSGAVDAFIRSFFLKGGMNGTADESLLSEAMLKRRYDCDIFSMALGDLLLALGVPANDLALVQVLEGPTLDQTHVVLRVGRLYLEPVWHEGRQAKFLLVHRSPEQMREEYGRYSEMALEEAVVQKNGAGIAEWFCAESAFRVNEAIRTQDAGDWACAKRVLDAAQTELADAMRLAPDGGSEYWLCFCGTLWALRAEVNLGLQQPEESMRDIERAGRAFEESIALNPAYPTPRINLAFLLYRLENIDAAIVLLQGALDRMAPGSEREREARRLQEWKESQRK